jgi:Arc/MetJ family transcription regulator
MRTNIEIDDQLMKRAMRSAKTRTKRATVEEGLRLLIRLKGQQGIRRFRGRVRWQGNLEESRRSWAWRTSMVIVDTTVWVDYLNGADNPETEWLDREIEREEIGLTELILCEVLQGVRSDREFTSLRKQLLEFAVFSSGGWKWP